MMSAMARAIRLATEPNDLDCEVDEGPCAAYEWVGLGEGYQCDAVFHIALSRDQLAKCSLCGGRVGSLAKCLFQFSGCSGMVLAPAGCTYECGYDGVLGADSRVDGVARCGRVPSGGQAVFGRGEIFLGFPQEVLAWFMCSGEAITQLRF